MNKKALLFLASITLISTATCANLQQPADPYKTVASTVVEKLSTSELETIAKSITVKVHVGEDRGSGFLIGKNDNTYKVVTNAHVAERGNNYFIETPDGIKHQATLINKDGSDGGNDLAMLEFTSTNAYQLAQISNNNKLSIGDKVLAAGFPYDAKDIKLSLGNISLLPDKSLQGGYQIGFNNETIQGMSGGVLLNAKGKVIGILGKGKGAIFDSAYNYQDGTTPTAEQIETMKDASFSIPIASVVEVTPQLAALVPKQYTGIVKTVDDIAEEITVRIDNVTNNSNGSGVIVAKQDNIYYVATAKHVIDNQDEYQIITPDGINHQLDYQTVEKSEAYDLAIFSFKSDKDYQVATVGDYIPGVNKEQVIFVSGFPKLTDNPQPARMITGGKIKIQDETNFTTKDYYSLKENGQGILYTNISYGGMSGGAILDSDGKLIGIHTATEAEIAIDDEGNYDNLNLGFSLGVPIQDVLGWIESNNTHLDSQWLTLASHVKTEVSENDWKNIESQLLTITKPQTEEISKWMNYGNQMWRYEKYNEAIAAFEKVIEIDPNLDRAYYGLSLVYWSQGKPFKLTQNEESKKYYQKAVIALETGTKINPNPYHYWRWLGKFYGYIDRYNLALTAYNKAVQKNKDDFVLYVELGDVLSELAKYSEAFAAYQQAISLNPNHSWAYYNRGIIYYQLKQYDRSLADYTQAIALNNNFAFAYINRGVIYDNLKQYNKALVDYERAITIDSQNSIAYFNRGNTYANLKKYHEALENYNQAITLNPKNINAYLNRGKTYLDLEQYQKAIADFERVITIDTQYALAYNNRGVAYDRLKKYPQAIADFNQAIKIKADYSEAYNNRGNVYADLKQYDKAIANFNRAIETDPHNAIAYNNRGLTYTNLKQYQKAIANFTKAIEIDPQYAEAYFDRAVVYYELKQYSEAIADYKKAIEIDPQYIEAYLNRGVSYSRLGEIEKAIADFSKVIETDNKRKIYAQKAYYVRGLAYNQQKDYRQAIDDYTQAIVLNSQNAEAYYSRSISYGLSANWQQAQQDANQAANLFKQQENEQRYQDALRLLQTIESAQAK